MPNIVISLLTDLFILLAIHIYSDHIEPLQEQIKRIPKRFPSIKIKNKHENIEHYSIEDIEWIEKYEHHEPIIMEMSA